MEDQGEPPPSQADGPTRPLRCSRKTGLSNILAGVSQQQLKRLFRLAREGLAWGGGGGEEEEEKEEEEVCMEAGLAQALAGLRVRARRSRAGRRAEGRGETCWLKAFGHMRIRESSLAPPEGEVEEGRVHTPEAPPGAQGGLPSAEPKKTCDRPPWRSRVARHVEKDPERYLHHILH